MGVEGHKSGQGKGLSIDKDRHFSGPSFFPLQHVCSLILQTEVCGPENILVIKIFKKFLNSEILPNLQGIIKCSPILHGHLFNNS